MLILWVLAVYSAVVYRESSIGDPPIVRLFFYQTLGILAISLYIFIIILVTRQLSLSQRNTGRSTNKYEWF